MKEYISEKKYTGKEAVKKATWHHDESGYLQL
jgi:hypothetical protein